MGDRATEINIEVWPCNLAAVELFRRCDIEGIGAGMAGVWWIGIGAQQIRAACMLTHVARKRWPDLLDDVRYMGKAVADWRNQRAADAAQRGR